VSSCDGRGDAVGAVYTPANVSRPAAWTSTDAVTWQSIPVRGESFYGVQNILYAVACRAGALAAIGAKSGGVHGNPRVSTWRLDATGTLVELKAAFTLYGGTAAVNVVRIAVNPAGWMMTGNRITGAAVWVSPDAADFRILENVAPLASDPGLDTAAQDLVATPQGWTVVGGGQRTGRTERDPVVWTSADGAAWTRTELPGDTTYEEMQRAALLGDEVIAVGLRGATFGTWRGSGGRWAAAGRFGATGATGRAAVSSVVVLSGGDRPVTVASSSDGTQYALWLSADRGDSWRPVQPPGSHPSGSDRALALGASGNRIVLVADDGRDGRMWTVEYTA